jgi:hypothetical protein
MSTSGHSAASVAIDVSIKNNTLIVGVNGGNVTGAPGEVVLWQAGDGVKAFTLQFFQLAAEPRAKGPCVNVAVAELPSWPFAEPPPPNGIVGPTRAFHGTLSGKSEPATAFKYSLAVGNLQLDPILILDR